METGHFNFRPYEKKSAHAKKKRKRKKKRHAAFLIYNNITNHSRCLFIMRFEKKKKLNNDPVRFRSRECSWTTVWRRPINYLKIYVCLWISQVGTIYIERYDSENAVQVFV